MKIAVLGSSGTNGVGLEPDQTWPAHLERCFAREGCDVRVVNMSSPGLPAGAYAERLVTLEQDMAPDAYLIQLPPPGRQEFGVNGAFAYVEAALEPGHALGWASTTNGKTRLSPTRIRLNRLLAREGSPFFPLLEKWLYPTVARNRPQTDFVAFRAFAEFWDLHVADSDLQHINHGKEIHALQLMLQAARKPYLMFDWHIYNCTKDRRLGVFASRLDYATFIGGGRLSAFEHLQATGEDLSGLSVDQHGHLNSAGHALLAQSFVAPAARSAFRLETGGFPHDLSAGAIQRDHFL